MTMTMEKHKTPWKGLKPAPKDYFGFCYVITNTETGKRYIGKKQYWLSSGRVKSRPTNITLKTWKWHHWKESDWEYYTGSSRELNKDIKSSGVDSFTFEIVSQHISRAELHYAEVDLQVHSDCLRGLLGNGERAYYNKQIAGVRFLPPPYTNTKVVDKIKRRLKK